MRCLSLIATLLCNVHHLDRHCKKTCFFRPGAVGLQQNSFNDHSCKLTRALMFSIEPGPTKSEHECNRRAQLRTACSPVDVLNPSRFAPPPAHHAAPPSAGTARRAAAPVRCLKPGSHPVLRPHRRRLFITTDAATRRFQRSRVGTHRFP